MHFDQFVRVKAHTISLSLLAFLIVGAYAFWLISLQHSELQLAGSVSYPTTHFTSVNTPIATPTVVCAGGWMHTSSPNAEAYNVLSQVDALMPNDVWAVGWRGPSNQQQTLIMHWDGA